MKFFIDTSELDEIRTAHSWGILDGVTTNPTLVGKTGMTMREAYERITEIVGNVPISIEVVSTAYDDIVREAREIASWGENVVVKVPMLPDGVRAIKTLSSEGIRINCTLVFSPVQALMAAKVGAYFISPFVGRLDDAGLEGMKMVEQIVQIMRNYGFSSQVLVGSIRHPTHVLHAALMGADIATMPFKVMEQLFKSPFTDAGLERFLEDWRKAEALRKQVAAAGG